LACQKGIALVLHDLAGLKTWAEMATVAGVFGALYVIRRDNRRFRAEDQVRRGDQARTVTLEFEDALDEAYQVGLPIQGHTYIVGKIVNFSERPLLDVRFELPTDPNIEVAELPHGENVAVAKVVPGGGTFSVWFDVHGPGPFDWTPFLNLHVRFTDANGVRWRRTEYIPPQEIVEPPMGTLRRLKSLRTNRHNLYTGTIDDFYDSAIGAHEVKELNVRAFRLGYVVAYWNGGYYLRPAAVGSSGSWALASGAADVSRQLDEVEAENSEKD
jgi:hypothetical protein